MSSSPRMPGFDDDHAAPKDTHRPLLQTGSLCAGYGGADVIADVSFTLAAGECLAILGRNGAGKTTLLHSLFNIGPQRRGSIRLHDQEIIDLPGHRIARLGMALVPQGRGSFPDLTVLQNLQLAASQARQPTRRPPATPEGPHAGGRASSSGHAPAQAPARHPVTLDDIFQNHPRLFERRHSLCANLSGGERQLMLLARALLTQAPLILLDEPSEGLAPRIIHETLAPAIRDMVAQGCSLLLAEQHLALALSVASRILILADGGLVFEGTPAELEAKPCIQREHLGLAA